MATTQLKPRNQNATTRYPRKRTGRQRAALSVLATATLCAASLSAAAQGRSGLHAEENAAGATDGQTRIAGDVSGPLLSFVFDAGLSLRASAAGGQSFGYLGPMLSLGWVADITEVRVNVGFEFEIFEPAERLSVPSFVARNEVLIGAMIDIGDATLLLRAGPQLVVLEGYGGVFYVGLTQSREGFRVSALVNVAVTAQAYQTGGRDDPWQWEPTVTGGVYLGFGWGD